MTIGKPIALLFAIIIFGVGKAIHTPIPATASDRGLAKTAKDEGFDWNSYKRSDSHVYLFNTLAKKLPRFGLPTHFKIHEKLNLVDKDGNLTNCSLELNRAAVRQDLGINAVLAKAHFDGCSFKAGLNYIEEVWNTAVQSSDGAKELFKKGRYASANIYAAGSMLTLGKALHAIQDFYAHSNFTEIQRGNETIFGTIEPIPLWTQLGRDQVTELIAKNGLVSGTVSYQIGQNECGADAKSHGELNKDFDDESAPIKGWEGRNLHRAAYDLAIQASGMFLEDWFNASPHMKNFCLHGVIFAARPDARWR